MKASAHFTNLTLDPGLSCLLGTPMTGMEGRDDPNDLITGGGLHGLKGLVELTVGNCALTDSNVLDLAKICPKLTSFNACFCSALTDRALLALAEHCPRLRCLECGEWNVTDTAVIMLADKCREMTHVNFIGCANLTDAAVIAIANNCPQLVQINVVDCNQLTDASVYALADKCRCLREAAFGSNRNLTGEGRAAMEGGNRLITW